jgi:hypothetical protein
MRIRKHAIVPAVTALLAAAAVAGPASAAAVQGTAGCPGRWALLPGTSAPSYAGLTSVSALSPRDAWFAGNSGPFGYGANAWRWNGHSVTAARPRIPATPLATSIWSVDQAAGPGSFDSGSDGWVLTTPDDLVFTGLASFATAEHWQGGRWTMTPVAVSPDPDTTGVQMHGVAALSPASAWAVGGSYRAGPGVEAGRDPIGALIAHWDGTQWRTVRNPAAAQPGAELNTVTAISATDIWAAGEQAGHASGSVVPLIEHWDGTQWRVTPAPAASQPAVIWAVSGTGAGDVWAAGAQTQPGTGNTAVPLIEHWNGSTWSTLQLPGTGNSALAAVYAASPDDVWAGGIFAAGLPDVFLHWDGSTWSTVSVPAPQGYGLNYEISAMGGTGADDIWAAGQANGYTFLARLSCR